MWYNFAPGAERVALESHRYLAFRDATAAPLDEQALRVSHKWSCVSRITDFVCQTALRILGRRFQQNDAELWFGNDR